MHQQCTGCHVALRATKPGSFVLRCPRCERRFAAKPAPPNASAPHRDDASGTSDLDVRPFGALFDRMPDPFSGGPDHSASTLDPSTPDSGGSDAGFGGEGGFDGGGSSGDF